jgi:hypothetical protein
MVVMAEMMVGQKRMVQEEKGANLVTSAAGHDMAASSYMVFFSSDNDEEMEVNRPSIPFFLREV